MKTCDNIRLVICTWELAIFVLLAVITHSASSQCEFGWKPGEGIPGVNGRVYAATAWDPDANGPQPEVLVVGGCFSVAGDVTVNNIASWDGSNWQPLGSGVGSISSSNYVFALTVYNNELIAAGTFTSAGGVDANYIAAWNGSTWQPLGGGIDGYSPGVHTLTVYNGELIAGGSFTTAGAVDANHIAAWNGNTWQPLGGGMSGYYPKVKSLMVYNGELIAGGKFTTAGAVDANNIARWNGSNWQAIGNGVAQIHSGEPIQTLKVYNGELIAGGHFTIAGDANALGIAKWDGNTWQSVGGGIKYDYVCALTIYNSDLIAGGGFHAAGGASAEHIAQWDGSTWQPLGSGTSDFVLALTVHSGHLIAGGDFYVAGDVSTDNIARWDGSTWQSLGSGMAGGAINGGDPYIKSLTVYNQELIAGGCFARAGNVDANCIAQWDGSTWNPFGGGVGAYGYIPYVGALTVYSGQLIAGGYFDTPSRNIARWDGSAWQPLGSGLSGTVDALVIYNSQLIAGGGLTNVFAWNGSTWQPLGVGMSSGVRALTVYNGELIAGGFFVTAGGVNANKIARWNGSTWQPVGSGIGGYYDVVFALTVYDGELIAGGDFTTASGVDANYIAAWDGNGWQSLGNGMNGPVHTLTVYNGELIAAGEFTSAGGVDANNIARWDGSTWQPLGEGIDVIVTSSYDVMTLTVYKGELIVGGAFYTVGNTVSAYLARWGLPLIYEGDLNHDCSVDYYDLRWFVEHWLEDNCECMGFCYEADLNYNGRVDFFDYAVLLSNWLGE
jgi:hypothetical protein